jgi:hypothetical protein
VIANTLDGSPRGTKHLQLGDVRRDAPPLVVEPDPLLVHFSAAEQLQSQANGWTVQTGSSPRSSRRRMVSRFEFSQTLPNVNEQREG